LAALSRPDPSTSVSLALITSRCLLIATFGSVAGIDQHAAEIDHELRVDIFVLWPLDDLSLVTDGHAELPIVALDHGADLLEKLENSWPLDVVADRVLKNLADGIAVPTA
jgi:hypothetical protein